MVAEIKAMSRAENVDTKWKWKHDSN